MRLRTNTKGVLVKFVIDMRKIVPIIMVLVFWGIFLLGMNNPQVGECVIAITIIGVVFVMILGIKKSLWKLLKNSGGAQN